MALSIYLNKACILPKIIEDIIVESHKMIIKDCTRQSWIMWIVAVNRIAVYYTHVSVYTILF